MDMGRIPGSPPPTLVRSFACECPNIMTQPVMSCLSMRELCGNLSSIFSLSTHDTLCDIGGEETSE